MRKQNLDNLKTERKGIDLLDYEIPNFLKPVKEQKIKISGSAKSIPSMPVIFK